jgi:hypothetical protein
MGNGDDHLVEQFAGAIDHIEVTVGHGIEAAWINRASSHWRGTSNVQASFARLRRRGCSIVSQCELLKRAKSGR